jgi:hypothetical protein
VRRTGLAADHRPAWLLVLAGAALALAIQVVIPGGVPLYDGVVVQEPYRYLHPVGDQAGSPTSFTSGPPVTGAESPLFVAATTESPPQAQLIAQKGALQLTPGATALRVSITPIDAPPAPIGGAIAGNVYRVSVTDQSGTPLPIRTCEGCISLVMRAPDGIGDADLQRYSDDAWTEVDTIHAGMVGLYQVNPKVLGDYAVIAATEVEGGIDTLLIVVVVAVVLLVAGGVFLLFGVRQSPAPPPSGGGPRRVPSKRRTPPKAAPRPKAPSTPPTGRSN